MCEYKWQESWRLIQHWMKSCPGQCSPRMVLIRQEGNGYEIRNANLSSFAYSPCQKTTSSIGTTKFYPKEILKDTFLLNKINSLKSTQGFFFNPGSKIPLIFFPLSCAFFRGCNSTIIKVPIQPKQVFSLVVPQALHSEDPPEP